MIFPDAKEGDDNQDIHTGAQEEPPNVVVPNIHTEQGAVGGEEDYLLDNVIEDEEEDEDEKDEEKDEEEEMEKLFEQQEKEKDPNFDEMITQQVPVGNI